MSRAPRPALLLAAGALLAAPPAARAAGGSYAVDDASVTPEGWCQVESWVRGYDPHATEVSTGPACTRNGVEYSVTATRVAGGGAGATLFTPGVKWVSGDLWWKRWSVGVAAQATLLDGEFDSAALYVPATIMLGSERAQLHANVGAFSRRGGGVEALLGLGGELVLRAGLDAIAEYARTGSDAKLWQCGLRWAAGDTLSVDVVRGRALGDGSAFWWTLGVNVAFE